MTPVARSMPTARSMPIARSLFGVVLSVCLASAASADTHPAGASADTHPAGASAVSNSPRELVTRFLTVFENLDLPAFIDCFAKDATVFFPLPEPAERFDGKAAIRDHFQQVFAAIRASAAGGPPYHRLVPEQLEIRMLGPDAAVVSFHLRNAQRTARRTLVLAKVHGHWLIEHLHASNVMNDGGG